MKINPYFAGVVLGIIILILIVLSANKPTLPPPVPPVEPPVPPGQYTVHRGNIVMIQWEPSTINSRNVRVGLIRKVGVNPSRYIAVEELGDVENVGRFNWVPTDVDENIYVEVKCLDGNGGACQALGPYGPYTVIQ